MAQTRPADEILVIDDGSTDGSAEIAEQLPVRVIQHEVNRGLGAARNTALEAAGGDLVASLDADCVPDPNWLGRLADQLERHIETRADRWRDAHMRQSWGDREQRDPPFIHGNNNLFERDALLDAGGYDESLRTNGEDGDMSRRLYEAGHHLVYDPTAVVHHLRRDTIGSAYRTFWRYVRYGSRPSLRQPRLRSTLVNIGIYGLVLTPRLIARDLRNWRPDLLPMDLGLPFYALWLEWQALRAG